MHHHGCQRAFAAGMQAVPVPHLSSWVVLLSCLAVLCPNALTKGTLQQQIQSLMVPLHHHGGFWLAASQSLGKPAQWHIPNVHGPAVQQASLSCCCCCCMGAQPRATAPRCSLVQQAQGTNNRQGVAMQLPQRFPFMSRPSAAAGVVGHCLMFGKDQHKAATIIPGTMDDKLTTITPLLMEIGQVPA